MDAKKHPPCGQECPDRKQGCHSGCEKYAEWKAMLEREAKEREHDREAARGIADLTRERKDWLRKRGYKA